MKNIRSALGAAALLTAAAGSADAAFLNIIDPLNPTFTQALGINDSGIIAGYGNASTFNGFTLPSPYGSANFTRLNVPGADGGTQVIGISNGASPTTVGFSVTGGVTNGFANTGGQGGTFTTVDVPGFAFTQLLGINHSGNTAAGYWTHDVTGATGQIAGTISGGPSFTSPIITNINNLLPVNFNSQATGVNNAGTAVGFYQYDALGDFLAFVDKGGMISSFQFPGSVSTQALGINDLGEIVGDYILNGEMFGFFDNNGVFTTLNPPGATSATANGINDRGQVVGFYTAANGDTIGFLTKVPEPAPLLVLGSGLLGLALIRRRLPAA